MRAFLVFTEREPKIVALARDEASKGRLAEDLAQAGINQFVAHEIAVDRLRENYGVQFEVIEAEVRNGRGLRVLDSSGRSVLAQVQLADIGPVIAYSF
jgi:DNA polymerase IIIc chi subunit